MALKTCPHCGHNVSDQAIKCPSCGKDPRYTDFQLEQQEQQHKKKRKTAIIIVAAAVVFLATLYFSLLRPAIKYQSACRALESQDYRTAAESFISLGEYRDSGKLAQKAMYNYVNAHMNSKDATSVRYVKKLQQLGYPGADDLSSRLYKWWAVVLTCADPDDRDSKPKFHDGDPIYFHATFGGGEPGKTLTFRYEVFVESRYSGLDDHEEKGTAIYDPAASDNTWWYGWEDFPANGYRYASIKIYDDSTNELLGEAGALFTPDSTTYQQAYTPASATEPTTPEPPDTSDIVIPDVPDYSHILDKYEDDTYTSDTTPQEKPKKQKYVRQYNSETGEWEWTWIDDE